MELIHFQGLHCFHDCVISLANRMGVNYPAAFASLWSETDFRYDPYRETYLSKRIITGLEILGARVECFDCFSQEDVIRRLALFDEDEFIIAGADAFYIPWNQFYQTFHGFHYFIAQNVNAETLPCADPTYQKADERIERRELVAHTFDIGRLSRAARKPLRIEAADEAREITRTHPGTRRKLLSTIQDCVNEDRKK